MIKAMDTTLFEARKKKLQQTDQSKSSPLRSNNTLSLGSAKHAKKQHKGGQSTKSTHPIPGRGSFYEFDKEEVSKAEKVSEVSKEEEVKVEEVEKGEERGEAGFQKQDSEENKSEKPIHQPQHVQVSEHKATLSVQVSESSPMSQPQPQPAVQPQKAPASFQDPEALLEPARDNQTSSLPALQPEIHPAVEEEKAIVVTTDALPAVSTQPVKKKGKETYTQPKRVLLEVRTSRTGEETPESMVQFLSSLVGLRKRFMLLWKKGIPLSMELAVVDQTIHFYLSVPVEYQAFVESQLVTQYSKAMLAKSKDYLPDLLSRSTLTLARLKATQGYVYPIRTYADFKDVDPMSSLLGILAKAQPGDSVSIQYLLVPINQSWQGATQKQATAKQTDSTGATTSNPHAAIMTEKASAAGFSVSVRIAVAGDTKERAQQFLYEIGNSFTSFNHPSGNGLQLKKMLLPWQKQQLVKEMEERHKSLLTPLHTFNVKELATLFHFPGKNLATIPNIAWHKVILSQAPENLPVADGLTDPEKKEINFFARTEFKNKQTVFGIKRIDRRRHVYVIGKSGTGKSTLIANMAISDIRNGEGLCVIDPHGDLCEHILSYIPSYRVNDVIYMDPSDNERSFAINPLEVTDDAQKELVASGIVAIFKKLYGTSWGPRLEYILRNTIVSIIEMPNPTLLMVPEMLANPAFRKKVVERLTDPVLKSFWENEFEKMTDKLRVEAISPIQNKVGQFTSSARIRNIIGHPKSSIDIEKAMNEGKILILNLSQGYLGEDNAALLGAMIITKIQLAAMNRVSIPEAQRRDFYLYVDEFQNFATTSFIKILSEARKFRLCLILANQYIAQIPEDVRAAIFGNAGTLMTFLVGAADASDMAKEFSERFKEEDLLALGNYQAILKLYIDGITQSPFHCYTLPLPRSVTQNREKVMRISRERYTKPLVK